MISADPVLLAIDSALPILLIGRFWLTRRMRRRLTSQRDEALFRVESLEIELAAQQALIANLRYRLRILRAAREEIARTP